MKEVDLGHELESPLACPRHKELVVDQNYVNTVVARMMEEDLPVPEWLAALNGYLLQLVVDILDCVECQKIIHEYTGTTGIQRAPSQGSLRELFELYQKRQSFFNRLVRCLEGLFGKAGDFAKKLIRPQVRRPLSTDLGIVRIAKRYGFDPRGNYY
jgi:hypothetical protein